MVTATCDPLNNSLLQQLLIKGVAFKAHSPNFNFIIKPDEMENNELNLKYFNFFEIENLDLELIDLKHSVIWTNSRL